MAACGAKQDLLRRDETGVSPLRKVLEKELQRAKRQYKKAQKENKEVTLKYGICLGWVQAINIIEHYEKVSP